MAKTFKKKANGTEISTHQQGTGKDNSSNVSHYILSFLTDFCFFVDYLEMCPLFFGHIPGHDLYKGLEAKGHVRTLASAQALVPAVSLNASTVKGQRSRNYTWLGNSRRAS